MRAHTKYVFAFCCSDENEDVETNERLENRRAKAAKVAKVCFEYM